MFSGLVAFLSGLFSSSKMQDVAIDGLRKIGGLNELTPKEQQEYILRYIEATKTQSPVRRLIALSLTALYGLMVLLWIVTAGVGYLWGVTASLELAGALRMFFENVITQPFNLVLSFYFVMGAASKLK